MRETRCFIFIGVLGVLLPAGCVSPPSGPGQGEGNPGARSKSTRTGGGRPARDLSLLEQYAQTNRFRYGVPCEFAFPPDGRTILFLRSPARSPRRDLYEFDVTLRQERLLLAADALLQGEAESIPAEEAARRERSRLTAGGISSMRLSPDGSKLLIPLSGDLYVVERAAPTRFVRLPRGSGSPEDARFSPNGQYVSFAADGNLCVVDLLALDSGVKVLTLREGDTISNATAEFVAQEEMGRFEGYWWSPDSTRLVYQQTDESQVELLHALDPARPEQGPRAQRYPRAGKANASVRLGIVSVTGAETTWIRWDSEQYPYLATVRWTPQAPLTILVQNRAQTQEVLLAVDPSSGECKPLLIERDEAWVNLDQAMPLWLPDGSGFLWTTEREGVRRLEWRDRDGRIIRSLTPADFPLRAFVHYETGTRTVVVSGGHDPIQTHLFRVGLESTQPPQLLTEEAGIHSGVFSPDGSLWVHTAQLPSGDRYCRLRKPDGEVVADLAIADEATVRPINVEWTTVGDGPVLQAAVIRPNNFQRRRKYPVLLYVYGGPGHQTVTAWPRGYALLQWFADQGFIVATLDNRGTPSRGREWERCIKGDLCETAMADQIEGLRGLGARYVEMDLSRVGVFGWSFGGYLSVMGVLTAPEVFHAAAAGAPVTDWRDYDTHYTERYMGLPEENPSGYENASARTYARDLARPLLLIHGAVDDNVHVRHSAELADELLLAGRDFEWLLLPGQTHIVRDPAVIVAVYQRMADFFDRHLRR